MGDELIPRRPYPAHLLADPSLHLLSRVDPTFLLLPMLDVLLPPPRPKTSTPQSTSSSLLAEVGSYLPREDLFESVAGTMYRRLTETHGKIAGKGAAATLPPSGTDEEGSWVDIPAFGQLALARGALARLCSTQEASTTTSTTGQGQGEQYFRPSPRRIVSFLRSKVVALASAETFRSHPATLGRMLDRAVDDPLLAIKRANGSLPVKGEGEAEGDGEGEDDVKTRKVRTELALELVRAYVPVGGRVEELFEGVVKAGLMVELDEEERKRENHDGHEVGNEDAEAEAEAALREQEAESGRL